MDGTHPATSESEEEPEPTLPWAALSSTAMLAALAWTVAALVIDHLGRVTPVVLLASTVLAGLAVGVRLPAADARRGPAAPS